MKKAAIIILLMAAAVLPLEARDFKETEEILNSILKDEITPKKKQETPALEKKQKYQDKTMVPKETIEEKFEKTMTDDQGSLEKQEKQETPEKQETKEKEKEKLTQGMNESDGVLLKTGIQFYNSGMFDSSLKQFSELITKHGDSEFKDLAVMYSGKILMKQHQYDKAIEQFAAIQDKSGEYPPALYYTAETLSLKGNILNSVEYYMKVYTLHPEHALADDSLLKTGKAYMNSQKGQQALDSTLELIKYYPDRETVDEAYFMLGAIFMKDPVLKDYEKARTIYRVFMKKAQAGEEHFAKSPLRQRVEADLKKIEKNYFHLGK